MMRTKITVLLLALLTGVNGAKAGNEYIAAADVPLAINLSTTNPNRFHCVQGVIADIVFPVTVPLDAKKKASEGFVSYQALRMPSGAMRHAEKPHDLFVTCDGEVYHFNVIPKSGAASTTVRLGNPNQQYIEENAKIIRDSDPEQVYSTFIVAALNNDFLPNVSVQESYDSYPGLVDGFSIEKVREMVMHGAGIRLKEFLVRGRTGALADKQLFLQPELSSGILAITTYPPKIGKEGFTRLFIVENKK